MIEFFKDFLLQVCKQRKLVLQLAIRDFRTAYIGSSLGFIWLVLEPLCYISVLWFVFTHGLKVSPVRKESYFPWLMSSMIAWTFFSSVTASSPSFFKGYKYLLKRDFNFSILPVVKILSGIFAHLIFLFLLIIVLLLNGIPFSLFWFQSIYYLFCLSFLLLGVVFVAASVGLFFRDMLNVVGIFLQLGFWVSPVFWDYSSLPKEYRFFAELNPLSYPLEGYRNSFLYEQPFWKDGGRAFYFWTFSFLLFLMGAAVFRRLRPQFGEVNL